MKREKQRILSHISASRPEYIIEKETVTLSVRGII